MHNWSRRPSKLVHITIPIVAEISGGGDRAAKLAEFAGRWLKAHASVDTKEYHKSVIKMSSERGLVLECIFYPVRGAKSKQIKAEFAVMVLDAAKRLGLCLMPAEVRRSTPWSDEEDGYTGMELDDLMPSSELTERAGYKPKKT